MKLPSLAFSLLAMLVLPTSAGAQSTAPADVTAALDALPGFKLVEASATAVDSNHYSVTMPAGIPIEAGLFRGADGGPWRGWMSLTDPAAVSLGDAYTDLATVGLTAAFVVVAGGDGPMALADVPSRYQAALTPFFAGQPQLDLHAGVNLFFAGTASGGVIGQFKSGIGMSDGPVRITGVVGQGLLARVMGKAADPDALGARVAVVLPSITPPALNNAGLGVGLTVSRTELWAETTTSGVSLGGSFDASVTAFGATTNVTGALAVTKAGTTTTIKVSGDAALPTARTGLFNLAGLQLTRLGVAATYTNDPAAKGAAVALTAGVELPDNAGTLSGAVMVGASGLVVFLGADNLDAVKLVGVKTTGLSLVLPKTVIMLSTSSAAATTVAALPGTIGAMFTELGMPGTATITPKQGVTLMSSLTVGGATNNAPAGLDKLVKGTFIVTVAASKVGTTPTLEASLTLPNPSILPPPLDQMFAITRASVFIKLKGLTALEAGITGDLKLTVGTSVTVNGTLSAELGVSGAKVMADVHLTSDWVDALGLKDIAILSTTGVSAAIDTAGAFTITANGRARFGTGGDAVTIGLGGGVSVLFSTGIPSIKGLALTISASEFDLLTPAKIGQTVVRAVANIATKPELGLSTQIKAALNTVKTADLVGAVRGLLPTASPLKEMLAFKVKGPKAGGDAIIYLATPGMTGPGFDGIGVGVKLAGDLYNGTTRLGGVDAFLTVDKGFQLKADVADVVLGPLKVTGANVDIAVNPNDITDAHFNVDGALALFTLSSAVHVAAKTSEIAASWKVRLGALDAVDVGFTATVAGAASDFRITVKADLAKLRTALASGVKDLLDNGPGKALRDQVAVAKQGVADKETALANATKAAQADQASAKSAITRAEEELAAFRSKLSSLDGDLARANSSWQTAANNWDVIKMAEYGATIAGLELGRPTLVGLVQGAEATLTAAKEGATWFPISMYPSVIAATGDLNTAKINLGLIEVGVSGLDTVGQAVTALQSGLTGDISLDKVELINASLKQALLGNPQTLRVTLKFKGKTLVLEQGLKLPLPGDLQLPELFNKLFNATGGQPDQATIDAKMATLDLGFGDVVFYKDLARNGTARWIAGKKIGSPGWNELGFVVGGGLGGMVWGFFPGTADAVTLIDTKRDGTPGWVGPKRQPALDLFVKELGEPRFLFGGGRVFIIDKAGELSYFQDTYRSEWPIVHINVNLDGPGVNGKGTHARFFGGQDNVIYGIKWNGELWCYNAQGPIYYAEDGDGAQTVTSGKIGTGWNQFTHVFGGHDGVIYAINAAGQLKFYKHTGRRDCSATWTPTNNGATIGWAGWQKFRQVIGGDEGVMYAIPRRVVPLTPGAEVALWSQSYERFLRARDDLGIDTSPPAHFGGTLPGWWTSEHWKVIDGGNGTIALWSTTYKRFLRMNDRGDMDTTTTADGSLPASWSWERFKVIDLGAGRISLWSDAHQKFVKVIDGDVLGAPATPDGLPNLVNGAKPEVFIVSPLR